MFGASALVYVVDAHNTNVETKFWTSFLVSQKRWSTAAPTTGDMRFAQSQILLRVSRFSQLVHSLAILLESRSPEIPGPTNSTD